MSEPVGLDPVDWAVWREVSAMRTSVDRALEQRLQRDAGISAADHEVLAALGAAQGHRLRAGALAEALGWEKSRISHQVRRMVTRDLVHRTECPSDLRGTWVVLAPTGADALAASACGYVEVLSAVFLDRLTRDQKDALAAAAAAVRDGLLAPDPQAAPAPR